MQSPRTDRAPQGRARGGEGVVNEALATLASFGLTQEAADRAIAISNLSDAEAAALVKNMVQATNDCLDNLLPPTRHHVCELLVSDLKRSPENDQVYSGFSWDNADDRELYNRIEQDGRIIEPLHASSDLFILSGHRRYAVASLLGMEKVPVIVHDDIVRADHTADEWLALLLSYNVQRKKTLAELTREAVVEKSKGQAHRELIEARKARDAEAEYGSMDLSGVKDRSELSGEKSELVAAVLAVLKTAELPVSVRRCHYLIATSGKKILRNRNPKRWPGMRHRHPQTSAIVADEFYGLDHWSAADLSSVLTRLRSDGIVPWDSIIDETRPSERARTWDDAGEFVSHELRWLFRGYRRNFLQSQPFHFEVLLEKLGLRHVLKPICDRYSIQLTVGKGYSSADVAYRMAARFRESGRDKLVLFVMTDHDPDGLFLGESIGHNLLRDQRIPRDRLVSIRVGLTREQAEGLKLPTNNEPKDRPRNQKYIREHGNVIWELDAANEEYLRGILNDAIRSKLDLDLFNAEKDREAEESVFLDSMRQRAIAALNENGGVL